MLRAARCMHALMSVANEPSQDPVDYLEPLGNYVARRLRYHEALGDLRPNELAPEDILDELYVQAIAHLRPKPRNQALYPWLRMLADRILEREVSRSHAAAADADERPEVDLARRLPEVLPDTNSPLPEDEAAAAELQRAIARVVGELPPELREPLLMVLADGYEPDEVAALEGLPLEEVTRRVRAATELLRERIAREYGEEAAPSVEEIIQLMERWQPSPADQARARAQLEEDEPPAPLPPAA
jgi:DNA-directed RNA polymerase specialized sigma24 family protein